MFYMQTFRFPVNLWDTLCITNGHHVGHMPVCYPNTNSLVQHTRIVPTPYKVKALDSSLPTVRCSVLRRIILSPCKPSVSIRISQGTESQCELALWDDSILINPFTAEGIYICVWPNPGFGRICKFNLWWGIGQVSRNLCYDRHALMLMSQKYEQAQRSEG